MNELERSLTRITARVNPGNRTMDTASADYLEARRTAVVRLRETLRPVIQEAVAEDHVERSDHPELGVALMAHGLAEETVSRELAKRGIGWPLLEVPLVMVEGDDLVEYTFVDDPSVPLGDALYERVGEQPT